MPVFNIFSKRKKAESNLSEDIYQYDTAPRAFRVQVIHILESSIGVYGTYYDRGYHTSYDTNEVWEGIQKFLAREYGLFRLAKGDTSREQCLNFILDADVDRLLDIIEFSFQVITSFLTKYSDTKRQKNKITQDADDAVEELNHRFREHKMGYQFENGIIIKVDSEYVHTEAVKPVLQLLKDQQYEGAEQEFLHAHNHYREGRYKEKQFLKQTRHLKAS